MGLGPRSNLPILISGKMPISALTPADRLGIFMICWHKQQSAHLTEIMKYSSRLLRQQLTGDAAVPHVPFS